jgi:hypothetical protein
MPSHWPFALAFGVGIIGLFATVIVVGLRMRRRETTQNLQNLNADAIWNEFETLSRPQDGSWERRDLLYGIWEDFSATSVGMIVRDAKDSAIARVAYDMRGADISVGENRYRVRVGTTFQGSAELVQGRGSGDEVATICSFQRRGWFNQRGVEYRCPETGVLTISMPWGSPFKAFTSTITRDGKAAGKMGMIGRPYFNKGRMLIVPAEWPLPIRLFVITWGTGGR